VFELTAPDYEGIPSHWMTYLSVDDISKAEEDTSSSGGEIMRPPVAVPGVGKLAVVTDATGAMIGLIEPDSAHVLSVVHCNSGRRRLKCKKARIAPGLFLLILWTDLTPQPRAAAGSWSVLRG
jgi:hypothetical protein